MIAFHWSRLSSSASPPHVIPAFANIMSSPPRDSTTSSTRAETASASVTSRRAGCALPATAGAPARADLVVVTSSATRRAAARSMSATTTCAPAAASARTSAAPIPDPPPVTIAVAPAGLGGRTAVTRAPS